jgi:hypothetical protein
VALHSGNSSPGGLEAAADRADVPPSSPDAPSGVGAPDFSIEFNGVGETDGFAQEHQASAIARATRRFIGLPNVLVFSCERQSEPSAMFGGVNRSPSFPQGPRSEDT